MRSTGAASPSRVAAQVLSAPGASAAATRLNRCTAAQQLRKNAFVCNISALGAAAPGALQLVGATVPKGATVRYVRCRAAQPTGNGGPRPTEAVQQAPPAIEGSLKIIGVGSRGISATGRLIAANTIPGACV